QPPAVAARDERAVDIGDEHRADRAAVDDTWQIGLEDDVHPVLEDAGTMPTNTHGLADAALRTVSADQVLGANTAFRASRSIPNSRDDLVARLHEAHQLGIEAHVGAMALGMSPQNRFELILIAGRCRRRTDVARVSGRHPLPRDLGVAEILHPG